jgi:hypothetical protein
MHESRARRERRMGGTPEMAIATFRCAAGFGRYRLPLAAVVIGGPLTATLLTLLILPALYAYFVLQRSRPKAEQYFVPKRKAE